MGPQAPRTDPSKVPTCGSPSRRPDRRGPPAAGRLTLVSWPLRIPADVNLDLEQKGSQSMRRKYLIIGAGVLALAAGGAGAAGAVTGGGEADESSATGPAADRATAAALRITKGGNANAVERDGEKGATWEVEVTRPDGKTVDVRLDERYGLVVVDGDSEAGDSGEKGEGADQNEAR
ncbi:MAG: PepSY domain-containing protein [Solirubrobacteraceae bacterium]